MESPNKVMKPVNGTVVVVGQSLAHSGLAQGLFFFTQMRGDGLGIDLDRAKPAMGLEQLSVLMSALFVASHGSREAVDADDNIVGRK